MHSRALSLARELTLRGHKVAMRMPPWHTPEKAGSQWQEDGVLVRYVPLHGGVPGITRRLLQETLAWQPEIVHCFKPKAYSGLAGWWLWQFHRRRIPLVMDTDDWEGWGGWNDLDPYTPVQKHFFAWQEQWGMRHCHLLTAASRALQTVALSMGIARERVLYVPNGPGIQQKTVNKKQLTENGHRLMDTEQQLNGRPTILLYSRLFEFDTRRLVAVLNQVKTAVPNFVILSVGAGLHENDAVTFRKQLTEAGLSDNVVDVGWVESEYLPALLTLADVGIYLMDDTLLNRTKCPVKLADMAALGIPVVGEAVGQVSEYVRNGRSGLLRSSGDIDGLAADLVHLLTDKIVRAQFADAAKTHIADHFRWSQRAAELEQAYQQLLTQI
ncbi:MAG: glycosyltransferase [Anaerolineales bacterium]|nr:glycosyltransferase [Anaerolineales bacterium]